MNQWHRALVRHDGKVVVMDRPTRKPEGYELTVKPIYAGLCGTDIQMLRGLRDDPSQILGHEGIARVSEVGKDVPANLAPGTLVCINPTHRSDPAFLLGHNVEGLLQENVLIPAIAVRDGLVIPLSTDHHSATATLLEPLAAVHYAFELLSDHNPDTLVVFGDGVIGHLAVRAAADKLVAGIRIQHLHHTEQGMAWSRRYEAGAAQCVLNNAAGMALLSSLSEGARVAVLIATPRNATLACLETALRYIRGEVRINLLGGLPADAATPLLPGVLLSQIRAVNCAGKPMPGVVQTHQTSHAKTVQLVGQRGVANRHLRSAADELMKQPERYSSLITHTLSLEKAADVMTHLASSAERQFDGRRLIKLAVQFSTET
ncbi:alcohol dehydrogenase catalytic domain-containing protein [Pantoea sp. UYEF8]|uniref:alcohol dehydrogenase catalytic domain-containing protein n=1 Tax=Pantoea sp. UYEF8 TaxID=1756394 RepID=UPI003399FA77